jgi:hypothetical protein
MIAGYVGYDGVAPSLYPPDILALLAGWLAKLVGHSGFYSCWLCWLLMMTGYADIPRNAGCYTRYFCWLCWLYCVDVLAMSAGYIDYLCWRFRLPEEAC